jgi:RNA polymerase sigma factor (sigma-70 family)
MSVDEDGRTLITAARLAVARYLAAHPRMLHHADDIESDAHYGAALAYARHNPALGATLHTFAHRRAYGAILDGVRHRSPINRDQWRANPDPQLAALATPRSTDELRDYGWDTASHEHGYTQVDDRDQLRRLLADCPPAQREAVVLSGLYGYTADEIGQLCGRSGPVVAQSRWRCQRRLRGAA